MKIEIEFDGGFLSLEREGEMMEAVCPFNERNPCTWFCPHFGYSKDGIHLTCGSGREWDGIVKVVKEEDDDA